MNYDYLLDDLEDKTPDDAISDRVPAGTYMDPSTQSSNNGRNLKFGGMLFTPDDLGSSSSKDPVPLDQMGSQGEKIGGYSPSQAVMASLKKKFALQDGGAPQSPGYQPSQGILDSLDRVNDVPDVSSGYTPSRAVQNSLGKVSGLPDDSSDGGYSPSQAVQNSLGKVGSLPEDPPIDQGAQDEAAFQRAVQQGRDRHNTPDREPSSYTPPASPTSQGMNHDDFLAALNQSNGIQNFGNAISQAAMGVQTPKMNTSLYSNMADQNKTNAGYVTKQNDRDATMNALRLKYQTAKDIAAMKGSNGSIKPLHPLRAKQIENSIENQNSNSAGNVFKDPNVAAEESKIANSNTLQGLINGIRNGDIKGSKNVSTQLTNYLAKLEMGPGGGSQAERQAMGIDTLYSKIKGGLAYFKGAPTDTIPSEYLDQIEHEGKALAGRSAQNYEFLTNARLSRLDPNGPVYSKAKSQQQKVLSSANKLSQESKKSSYPKKMSNGKGTVTVNNAQDESEASQEGYQ